MTLVYTDNGSEYINDGVMESIRFDREAQKVYITPCNDPEHSVREITNVQQVIYNVHAEPRAINDSCQEILALREEAKKLETRLHAECEHSRMMQEYAIILMKEDPDLYEKISEKVQENFKDYLEEQDKKLTVTKDLIKEIREKLK